MDSHIHNKIIERFNKLEKIYATIHNLRNKLLQTFKALKTSNVIIYLSFIIIPFIIISTVLTTIITNSPKIDFRNEKIIKIKITEFGLLPNKIIIQPRKKYDLFFEKVSIADCFSVKFNEENLERKIEYKEPFNFLLFYEGNYTITCKWIYDMNLHVEVRI